MDDNAMLSSLLLDLDEDVKIDLETFVNPLFSKACQEAASDEELGELSESQQEFAGGGIFKVEAARLYHAVQVERVGDKADLIYSIGEDYIRDARIALRKVSERKGRCVNFATILVAPDVVPQPGTLCSICRGKFGEEDGCNEAPSIIVHPNCRCRGLQIYGRQCISRALEICPFCPACGGKVKDDDLAREAETSLGDAYQAMTSISITRLYAAKSRLLVFMNNMETRRLNLLELVLRHPRSDPWTDRPLPGPGNGLIDPNSVQYLQILSRIVLVSRSAEQFWEDGDKEGAEFYLMEVESLCNNTIPLMSKTENSIVAVHTLQKVSLQAKVLQSDIKQADAASQDFTWPTRDWKLRKRLTPEATHIFTYKLQAFILLHPALYPGINASHVEALCALVDQCVEPWARTDRNAYRFQNLSKMSRLLTAIIGIGQIIKASNDNLIHKELHPLHVLQDLAEDTMRAVAIANAEDILNGKMVDVGTEKELLGHFRFVYLPIRLREVLHQHRARKEAGDSGVVTAEDNLDHASQESTSVPDEEWKFSGTWISYFDNGSYPKAREDETE